MNQNKKADLQAIGLKLKTNNFADGEIRAFSYLNSTTETEQIAFIRPRFIRGRRTVRNFDWKRQKPGRIKAI